MTATLAVHRAPVGHGMPLQLLFRLPVGYRPPWPITWTTAAWPMTARGRSLLEAPAVTVILEARPDGTVYHLDAPTLDGAGYARYRTAITWMTEETAPLLMARTFMPAAEVGTVRLERRRDTVTATLAFPPVDKLGAVPPRICSRCRPGSARYRPCTGPCWTRPVVTPGFWKCDRRERCT